MALQQLGVPKDFCAWLDKYAAMLSGPYCVYSEETYLYIFVVDSRRTISGRIDKIKNLTQRQLAMSVARQLRREGRQASMHTKASDIAKNILSRLHLDIQPVAQAIGLS